jgi:uncharacterized protein (TIGR02231 family)
MPSSSLQQPLRAPTTASVSQLVPWRMKLHTLLPALATAAAATLAGAGSTAWAQQPTADSSRITHVKVYRGSATVERVARVSAGARTLRLSCLPQSLDVQSLQISADASVRIAETNVQVQARELAGGCPLALDSQVREAEDQLALARADVDALKLAHDYLKTVATTAPPAASAGAGVAGTAALGSSTESLRRTALDTLTRLHQAQRKQDSLQKALNLLVQRRSDNNSSVRERVTTVTVTLAAERDAEVRVSYQVPGPNWAPHYRAMLSTGDAAAVATGSNSSSGSPSVRLERLAMLTQYTGEDWSNVQLVLATGQPQQNTTARLPQRWWLQVAPPPMGTTAADLPAYAAAPARSRPSSAGQEMRIATAGIASGGGDALPDFDVAVNDTGFATEFAVPQRVNLPSSGQRTTLTLDHVDASAQLVTRTAPALEEAAYLVALLPAPPGVWPQAPVALYRDRQLVGQGQLDTASMARLGLSFGRDERVRVRAEPLRENTASAGLTGARTERTQQRAYTVENRHTVPLNLQVLDAAPVSANEKITVESRYDPAPTDTAWQQQAGSLLWTQSLPPGATARFAVAHTVRYPKEVQLLEQR